MPAPVVHLVDDNEAVLRALTRLLASGGYRVTQYASGAALLKTTDDIERGIILLDVDMPQPDGFAVVRALAERSVDMPVIMMSGAGDLTVLALKAGVANFVRKPFGRGDLLSVLDQVAGNRPGPAQC